MLLDVFVSSFPGDVSSLHEMLKFNPLYEFFVQARVSMEIKTRSTLASQQYKAWNEALVSPLPVAAAAAVITVGDED